MNRRVAFVLLVTLVFSAGCVAGPGATTPASATAAAIVTPSASATASVPSPAPASLEPTSSASEDEAPVDPEVPVEDLKNLSAAAVQALDLCDPDRKYMDLIHRMGLIQKAKQTKEYVPVTGREPSINKENPAYIIQYKGEVPQPLYNNETWIDPVCVVVNSIPYWIAIGDRRLQDGTLVSPEPVAKPPKSLPEPKK